LCGFLVTNRTIDKLDYVTEYLARRGPDKTVVYNHEGITFVHFLLSITGRLTAQPFISDGVVCVYNGEIYNAAAYPSDGQCIIPWYLERGEEFYKYLDGEYAIVIVDSKKRRLLYYTDIFGTKPLYLAKDQEAWGLSSYRTPLLRMGFRSIERISAAGFDFDLCQSKNTFDDWSSAFERSVEKRLSNKGMFIGLSSGYDSGAIDCALQKLKVPYTAYTVGHEYCEGRDAVRLPFRKSDISKVEPSTLYNLEDDLATYALCQICAEARAAGLRVNISGQGADEIISDYDPKRVFSMKQALSKNFYEGRQAMFLSKEEHVAGAFGIETRYPFLDRDLVQEYLWLSPALKNECYKAPLAHYMTANSYPFIAGQKLGFGSTISRAISVGVD
jgi:asparagine synthase (glutamine-hydrolysing)